MCKKTHTEKLKKDFQKSNVKLLKTREKKPLKREAEV